MKKISTFISTTEFLTGAFVAFALTAIVFTFILTGAFVSRDFLRQNNIYLDGKYYQLCRSKR